MTVVPAQQSTQLFERIMQAARSNAPDTFTLIRLKQEATKLIASDAYHAYMMLGALGALEWNNETLDSNHKKAIAISDDTLSRINYAISLQLANRREDAFMHALAAAKHEPENLTLLSRAIEYASLAGKLTTAMELTDTLRKRDPLQVPKLNARDVLNVLNRLNVPEAEYAQGLRIVYETLSKQQQHTEETEIRIDDDPADSSVLVRFIINTTFEKAQQLDDEATARLCDELPDGGNPGALMFGIVGTYANANHAS
jgi:hypothetical protein